MSGPLEEPDLGVDTPGAGSSNGPNVSSVSPASNTPIIRRRAPAERARYLEKKVDELIDEVTTLKPKKWATKALPIMFACSQALNDFAEEFERGT